MGWGVVGWKAVGWEVVGRCNQDSPHPTPPTALSSQGYLTNMDETELYRQAPHSTGKIGEMANKFPARKKKVWESGKFVKTQEIS